MRLIRRFCGGSGVSRPGAVVVFAVAVCALSLLVSALMSVDGGAQGQQEDSAPWPSQQDGDFRVFEFGSMEERGEYVHCVSFVSPDAENPGWLLPGDETCYKEEPETADIGSVGPGSVSGQQSGSNVIIGKHYDYEYWRGPSLTIVGRNCAGGGITLTGGRWDNRISSTRNGCSIIQHFSYSRPYVFSGASISTVGTGANLGVMNNRTSGILYFGTLQPFVPPPTTPPSTAPPPPPPPRPQPPAPRPAPNITNIDVVAIEVTQGVQDWNNTVRLVRGRPTVVRAFMNMGTNSARASASVSANLVVSKVGSSDTETLWAINEGGRVNVSSGVASRRGRLDASLNFVLPEKWTKLASSEELNLSLRFGSGITNRCDSPANAQQTSVTGTCSVKVSFVDVREPYFVFVPFEVINNETCRDDLGNVAGTLRADVSNAQIEEQIGRIFSNMPFSQNLDFDDTSDYWIRSPLRIARTCDLSNVLNLLEARRSQDIRQATDDSASAGLDDAVFVDVVANDINIDLDAARASLSITDPPVLGEAAVAVSPGGLLSVKYTGHTSGIDAVGYRICDEADASRCSEATLSISVALGACTILGTEGDDVIEGTTGDDVICGLGGNDRINGKRGNDVIYGGSGDDILYGRDGDDIIYGGSGDDLILGHRGDDVLYGRLGDDRIYGGGGNDVAAGGKGADKLYGEADDDTLEGNQHADVIHGGRGDDTIIGGPGNDTIRGNQGSDTIYLGEGTDTLLGTAPEDKIIN